MQTIYRYQSVATTGPNGNDPRPQGPDGDDETTTLTELCELDGWRYVSVPDGITPTIPDAITTWQPVTLTDELREQIKATSPHTRLIAGRVIEQIRSKYSIDEELYFARISVGTLRGSYTPTADELTAIDEYQSDVEATREWGRARRAELGL